MAKHGNRGKGGNVASMAIESHGSGNRVGKTKVLGRSCLVYRLFWGAGCLLYSLSASEEEKGGFMGGRAAYVLWRWRHREQEGILRSGNQGPRCSTITISVLVFAFVADVAQCF